MKWLSSTRTLSTIGGWTATDTCLCKEGLRVEPLRPCFAFATEFFYLFETRGSLALPSFPSMASRIADSMLLFMVATFSSSPSLCFVHSLSLFFLNIFSNMFRAMVWFFRAPIKDQFKALELASIVIQVGSSLSLTWLASFEICSLVLKILASILSILSCSRIFMFSGFLEFYVFVCLILEHFFIIEYELRALSFWLHFE